MKIYPRSYAISSKEQVTANDIPLAYVESIETGSGIQIDYERTAQMVSPVNTYQKISDPDTYFFSSAGELVPDVPLKRIGNEYMFDPSNKEFTPQRFSYRCVLQRNGVYDTKIPYDIKIGVIEKTSDRNLSSKLISIFGDAAKRELCPENITINDRSTQIDSLINLNYKQADFVFINSVTGTGSVTIGSDTVSINDILDSNCNVWMSVESFGTTMIAAEESKTCVLSDPLLYGSAAHSVSKYPYQFDITVPHDAYPVTDFEYINLFYGSCPILVLKKKSKGFIVVSENALMSNLAENVKLIYEILIRIYVSAYCHTKTRTAWITNEPVQYYMNLSTPYRKNHEPLNLIQQIKSDGLQTDQPMNLADVLTSEIVSFVGIDTYSNLYFEKIYGTPDPVVDKTEKTILSPNQTIVIAKNTYDIFLREDDLRIDYDSEAKTITICEYKSSSKKINAKERVFTVSDEYDSYILRADDFMSGRVTTELSLVPTALYDDSGIKLATIRILKKRDIRTYDIRKLGGGAIDVNNYELIDGSNVLGRPYRKGSGVIVSLPYEYKDKESIIMNELTRIISSGEYPVLTFKGEE